jgi:hypothetical protein
MKGKLKTASCVVSLIAFLYVAAYFAAVRRGTVLQWSGHWVAWPTYVGLPDSSEACFRRLHEWDRVFLRPEFWAGTIPPEQLREQQLLAFEAGLKAAQAATKQQ